MPILDHFLHDTGKRNRKLTTYGLPVAGLPVAGLVVAGFFVAGLIGWVPSLAAQDMGGQSESGEIVNGVVLSESESGLVVAEIDDEAVTLGELSSYYMRNSVEEQVDAVDLREFLPLYTDYKLKLRYGLDNGLDEESSLLEEFEQYARQASYSYWLEQEVKDQLFETFKMRSMEERKAFHLLQRLQPGASPADELEARNKLMEAKSRIEDGEAIEDLDAEYSTQVRGRSAGGQLPWFSAGNTVKEFEDALYSLEPGEISEPIRSQFGFHLIQLQDVREKMPERLTWHIYFQPGDSAKIRAEEAWQALEDGRTWEEVAKNYTQDGGSRARDGLIGWIHHGLQYSEPFLEQVYAADPDLPYTSPVETNYGFHILRIDSVKVYTSEEQRDQDLRQKLENVPGYGEDKDNVLQLIASRGGWSVDEDVYGEVALSVLDADSLKIEDWTLEGAAMGRILANFNSTSYTAEEFATWLIAEYGDITGRQFRRRYLEEYRDSILESHLIEMTRQYFPEFDSEVRNYLHGLIVFRVSDDHIWNPATIDSTDLKAFHAGREEDYVLSERYDYLLMASVSDSILTEAMRLYDEGLDVEEVRERVPEIQVSDRITDYLEEPPTSYLKDLKKGERSESFEYRSRTAFIALKDILPSRLMTFEEAFNRLANDYQPVREEQFRDYLQNRYAVRTYPERIQ